LIDETSTKTNMAPLRGWAPKGTRLPGKALFGHWNTMTFLIASAVVVTAKANHEILSIRLK
jgi:putative transposase